MYRDGWVTGIDWTALQYWGLRILAAIAIIIATHFIAKAVKWAIAKGIDSIDLFRKANEDTRNGSVGEQIGALGYWVVWLVGLIVALQPLGLSQVLSPVRELTDVTFAYIPHIFGAFIFFLVGFIIAKVVRKIVEALLTALRVDEWSNRVGLANVSDPSAASADKGISGTIALIVFVLIIIPVAIGALQILGVSAISEPSTRMLDMFLLAIPRIIGAVLWLAVAYVIGVFAKNFVERLLPSLGFDRSMETVLPSTASSPSKMAGVLVFTAIMLFASIEAARQLGGEAIAGLLVQVTDLGGRVIFGAAIIVIGTILARIVAGFVASSTEESGWAQMIVRYAIIALAVAMGLRFMGLANEIVNLAFGLILGSAAVAAALAFGLGGRPTAHKLLERWSEGTPPPAPKTPKTPPPPPAPPA